MTYSESKSKKWNNGKMILLIISSFICPLLGWILGSYNIHNHVRCNQAKYLLIFAWIGYFCINIFLISTKSANRRANIYTQETQSSIENYSSISDKKKESKSKYYYSQEERELMGKIIDLCNDDYIDDADTYFSQNEEKFPHKFHDLVKVYLKLEAQYQRFNRESDRIAERIDRKRENMKKWKDSYNEDISVGDYTNASLAKRFYQENQTELEEYKSKYDEVNQKIDLLIDERSKNMKMLINECYREK